jgi:ubiquinone/menaquinone biosynthesis C-methylase UbiE
MAAIARQQGIKVLEAYAEELPFEAESFDFVLMVTVLCFLADSFRALSEATRVLKPQGRLIIGMIDPVGQLLKWLADLGYTNLKTCQTIFQDSAAVMAPQPVKEGHGKGVFVVIAREKSGALLSC